MISFEQIRAMHQQVRKFVEKQHPDFKVKSIDGYTTTEYHPPIHGLADDPMTLEWLPIDIGIRFRVEAMKPVGFMRLTCEVYVTSDGTLYMADQQASRPTMRERKG